MSLTSVQLQNHLEQPLADFAAAQNQSKDWVINQAIEEYLGNQELQKQRWRETIPALNSVKAGNKIPAEEVELWLRSWGTVDEKAAPA